MLVLRVQQDEHGFWFMTREEGGGVSVITHAASLDDAIEDAEMVARREGGEVVVEPAHRAFTEKGHAPGYTPPDLPGLR